MLLKLIRDAFVYLYRRCIPFNTTKTHETKRFTSSDRLIYLTEAYNQQNGLVDRLCIEPSSSGTISSNLFRNYKHVNQIIISEIYNRIKFDGCAFKKFKNVLYLRISSNHLSSNQLDKFPDDLFFGLARLSQLDISWNKFVELTPNLFDSLNGLTDLNISNNQIQTLPKNQFLKLTNLTSLNLSHNILQEISMETFQGLKKLNTLDISFNKLSTLPANVFDTLKELTQLNASFNQIKELSENVFDKLEKLKSLHLSNNQLVKLPANIYDNLNELECLDLSNNKLDRKCLLENTIKKLGRLIVLNLHPIDFNVFKSIFNYLKILKSITLYDEFTIEPRISEETDIEEINETNVSECFGKKYSVCESFKSEFYLSSKSFYSIKLLDKKYKTIQSGFKWANIPSRLSVITGKNGTGKTSLLQLINQSISNKSNEISDLCMVKYFSAAENNLYFEQSDLDKLDQILISVSKGSKFPRPNISDILYDNMDYFSLIQYFDYLLASNQYRNVIDKNLEVNEKLFKFKFDPLRLEERRTQQGKFQIKWQAQSRELVDGPFETNYEPIDFKYFDGIKPIEYYLKDGQTHLSEDHKLSPGENLILLLELWRIHAKILRHNSGKTVDDQIMPFPNTSKLRILLLDEPDSHMYPSLIKDFIDLLSNKDLDYFRFQVIMTTHNPVTISFVPIESIFEMAANPATNQIEMKKATSKKQAML